MGFKMDILNLIISLISGVAGSSITSSAMKEKGLGALGNILTGLLGGAGGGYLLQILDILNKTNMAGTTTPATGTEFDFGTLLANIGSSGVGGALLSAIVAWIKNSSK
ncbi:hypothetical protein BN1013_00603 [Candidatus Rubidus massiliensis]|nr:hypothetical protein BN1013_00603 [Candidatus Rubidus massiliensis]